MPTIKGKIKALEIDKCLSDKFCPDCIRRKCEECTVAVAVLAARKFEERHEGNT